MTMDGQDEPTQPGGYGRFIRSSVAGMLIPGVGLIAAGRRRVGFVVLVLFLAGVAVVVGYALSVDQAELMRVASVSAIARRVGFALVGVAVVWITIGVVGFFLLKPSGLSGRRRFAAGVAIVAAAAVVAAPLALGAQRAFTHQRLIESVFSAGDDEYRDTIPEGVTETDPWAGESRVNVLLLGSDGAPERDGTRTDTIMVASVDVDAGDTVLFSLPRNLQHAQMPEGELREAYPEGYRGPEEEAYYWLSSVYRNLPQEFPDLFEDYRDPGAEAMKLVVGAVLDLKIDYYAMVNLAGFEGIVDALGGVNMDVPYDIPIGTEEVNGYCTEPQAWVEAGKNKKLNGYEALWVARARCGPGEVSGDYSRMRRQRCVLAAIADKADPQTVLINYQKIAAATTDSITTDIPQDRLPAFVELGRRIKDGELRSLPFTNEIVAYHAPDYELIHRLVIEAIEEPSSTPSPSSSPTTSVAEDESSTGDDQPDEALDGKTKAEADEAADDDTDDDGEGISAQNVDAVC